MSNRSEYYANQSLQPIEPSSWTKPAPIRNRSLALRCRVAEPSLVDRIRGALPGVFGALCLAFAVFLPVALHWA